MANDPYSACICGSGKKLKFCCQDILADMQRIEQLRDNQPDVAEQHLRALYESHPEKEILVIELAGLVQDLGQYDEARELCVDFLRRHRNEVRVIILLSDLTMEKEGFDGARRLIHRAVQLAQPAHYQGISMLMATVADELFRSGNPASAYAHLRRSIQFAPAELESSLLMLLSTWMTKISEYFPLLGSFELLPVDVAEEHQESEQKARRLSDLGCWEPSAILYSRLVKEEPRNGPLWHNLGLFYLWDDRPALAAAALHRSATLLEDFDAAVNAEALAVILDLELSDDRVRAMENSQRISRPRELSSRLQADSRFRLLSPMSELHSTEMSHLQLSILSAAPAADDGGRDELGQVLITANADNEADNHFVTVTATESLLDEAWNAVRAAAGDSLDDDQEPAEPSVASSIPSCFADFYLNVQFEPSLSAKQVRTAVERRIDAAIDAWLQRPQPALNGLTPLQASLDESMKIQTAAAVVVLYSIAQRMNQEIRLPELRQRLKIPAPVPTGIDADQTIESVPLLRYSQLPLSDLTDSQLVQLAHRVGLIRDLDLLEVVVDELFRRPQALLEFSPQQAHMMRALVARCRNRVDDMSESFEAARRDIQEEPDHFRALLDLDMKELTYRLDDPEDPGIPQLLRTMRDRYFLKIPEIEEAVRQQLRQSGCEQLLSSPESPVIVAAGSETQSPSSGKLWLPGQD